MALYEKQQALIELYEKLSVAEAQSKYSTIRIPHKSLMNDLRENINGKKI
jgi:hypothetical protein